LYEELNVIVNLGACFCGIFVIGLMLLVFWEGLQQHQQQQLLSHKTTPKYTRMLIFYNSKDQISYQSQKAK
jgi:hypothetical protein